jgi:hypothetical protein
MRKSGWDDYPGGGYSPWYGFGGSGRANIWITPAISTQVDFTGDALLGHTR